MSADEAFPRSARLLHRADYQRVFARPLKKSADRYLTVLARPNRLGYARLGLAISKKQARRAVQRNRLKRLIRESFRLHRPALGDLDLVVMARAQAASASNTEIFAALLSHWQSLIPCANSCSD